MRLLFLWVVAMSFVIQASVLEDNDFIYNILLRTGVVNPEEGPRALTDTSRTKRCRWKLCGTGRRFRFVRK